MQGIILWYTHSPCSKQLEQFNRDYKSSSIKILYQVGIKFADDIHLWAIDNQFEIVTNHPIDEILLNSETFGNFRIYEALESNLWDNLIEKEAAFDDFNEGFEIIENNESSSEE